MPSPFPGMDPYLEQPANWRDVHSSFITELRNALNRVLPSGFVARSEQRLYVVEPDNAIYPDVALLRRGPVRERSHTETGGVAVADPPIVFSLTPEEVAESYVTIFTVQSNPQAVTAIELLSPANKARGRGRESYLDNRAQLLRSEVNLLEIDLLRGGEVTVIPGGVQAPGQEYLVSLHRGDGRWNFETWPFGLRQRLPRVAVPLTEDLPDVVVDLQAILNEVYDSGKYEETIDYRTNPPPPPVTAEGREWLDGLLRDAGLRT